MGNTLCYVLDVNSPIDMNKLENAVEYMKTNSITNESQYYSFLSKLPYSVKLQHNIKYDPNNDCYYYKEKTQQI